MNSIRVLLPLVVVVFGCTDDQKFNGKAIGSNSNSKPENEPASNGSEPYSGPQERAEGDTKVYSSESNKPKTWEPLSPPVNIAGTNLVGSDCIVTDVVPDDGTTDFSCRYVDETGSYFKGKPIESVSAKLEWIDGTFSSNPSFAPYVQSDGTVVRVKKVKIADLKYIKAIHTSAKFRGSSVVVTAVVAMKPDMEGSAIAQDSRLLGRKCSDIPGSAIRVEVFENLSAPNAPSLTSINTPPLTEVCPELLSTYVGDEGGLHEFPFIKGHYILRANAYLNTKKTSQSYRNFAIKAEQGVRVVVNGAVVIDEKTSLGYLEENSDKSTLMNPGNNHVEITQFNSSNSDGTLKLKWAHCNDSNFSSCDGNLETIPSGFYSR